MTEKGMEVQKLCTKREKDTTLDISWLFLEETSGNIWTQIQEIKCEILPLNCIQWCVQSLDYKVRTLTGDLGQRDDHIAKLQKEKRALEELQQVDKPTHAHTDMYT